VDKSFLIKIRIVLFHFMVTLRSSNVKTAKNIIIVLFKILLLLYILIVK